MEGYIPNPKVVKFFKENFTKKQIKEIFDNLKSRNKHTDGVLFSHYSFWYGQGTVGGMFILLNTISFSNCINRVNNKMLKTQIFIKKR